MTDEPTQSAPAVEHTSFSGEKPFCDIVMKGGITSGVVYPLAVVEIARNYRLKNIGGASAGAIAASIAAAAELGRNKGGFQKLEEIVGDVSVRLPTLFQARPSARPFMSAILGAAKKGPILRKIALACTRLCVGYWPAVVAGTIPGLILAGLACGGGHQWSAWILALLVLPFGALAGVAVRIWRLFARELPHMNFGFCPGVKQPGYSQPGLTEWLIQKLDDLAGRLPTGQDHANEPLTFGDLQNAESGAPAINLEIMTTNLTEGRPYRIPFDTRRFFFRRADFDELFPKNVVDWMVANSKPFEDGSEFRYLPEPAHFPVIVAVRMSLSFPILLAAVPLYSRDFTLRDEKQREIPHRCWFSDGGIGSNFPIHFFDSVWPRWPTFGITLGPFDPDRNTSSVYLPGHAGGGLEQSFRAIGSTGDFLGAIMNTMQEWRDNLQSTLSGYRERIVRVYLKPDEGGLNLHMPPELVRTLAGYGREAGVDLCTKFDWNAHRWKRFLVWMAKLEETFERMELSYNHAPPNDRNLRNFLKEYGPNPTNYEPKPGWLDAAEADIADLFELYERWRDRGRLRDGPIPKPDVDFRLTPKV